MMPTHNLAINKGRRDGMILWSFYGFMATEESVIVNVRLWKKDNFQWLLRKWDWRTGVRIDLHIVIDSIIHITVAKIKVVLFVCVHMYTASKQIKLEIPGCSGFKVW